MIRFVIMTETNNGAFFDFVFLPFVNIRAGRLT